MKPKQNLLAGLAGLTLVTLPAMSQTLSPLNADGQSFDGYFIEHDGQEWLLIGRGREGWEFDSDGQGLPSEVSQDVGTPAAFAPKCYSDAIIIDLLDQQGDTSMANVTMRLSRASDTTGTVEFQDIRWTDFVGNGDAFTWDMGAGSATYSLTTDFKNAPAGLSGAGISTHTGSNSRDANHGNNAKRIFTWAWGGHNNLRGFSYGSSVDSVSDSATNYLWEGGNQGHAIGYTEVYIPYVGGPDETPPAIASTDPADDAVGAPIGAVLVATFDEPIALTGAGSITIVEDPNGTPVPTVITLPDASVTVSDSTLSIVPGSALANLTEYEVTIDALAIEDQATIPNAFGGTASGDWTFTTVAADATAPVITTLLPADEETAAGPADNLVVTFDENVLLNTGATSVLLDEGFESGPGGFTSQDNSGGAGVADIWAHGIPASSGLGGAVTGGAGGTGTNCWGSNIGDPGFYSTDANTSLISPIIDLNGLDSAVLSFWEALDLNAGDTLVVNVIDDTTPTVIAAAIHTSVDANTNLADWAAANGGSPIEIPSAALGQLVRLEFVFEGANTDGSYIGAYIDDVNVTGLAPGNAITLKNLTTPANTAVISIDDSSQVSVSGAVMTIDPTGLLEPGANYAIQIGANAIRNYNDIAFAGIADDTTWNFATASDAVFVTNANSTGNDTWSESGNWDIGAQPSGLLTGTIQAGLAARADSNDAVPYSGGLTFEAGASLMIGGSGSTQNRLESVNALGTGPITMNTGSLLDWRIKASPTVPALTLLGDASIVTTSNESHSRNFTFSNGITGAGQLTFLGTNNGSHQFTAASPGWSGGFVTGVASSARTRFIAAAEGAFGTGNVTVGASTDLQINNNNGGAGNVIDDAATLSIDGGGRDQSPSTKLIMNGSETVNQAFRNGLALQPGTYGNVGNGGVDTEVSWISGSGVLTVLTTAADSTAPMVIDIASPPAGGPIFGTPTIPYTVTFDEEVDPSSVDASDFTSIGTAPFAIGTVTQTSEPTAPSVFVVEVIPSGAGTVIFQVSGTILDFASNALVVPVDDDVTYTLDGSAEAPKDTIVIDAVATSGSTANPHLLTFDASGSDKLVVVVTGEHGFNNAAGNCSGITYDGEPLVQAVDRAPVASVTDTLYNDIWYLDDPGSFHTAGAISASVTTRGVITVFALSGTAPGVGTAAVGPPSSKYVDLLTTSSASLVITSHGMGGFNNNADTQNADTVAPLVEESAVKQGSNWNGHVTGSQAVASPSLVSATYTGGSVPGNHVIAAEFLAADLPVSGDPYDGWASGFVGLTDTDPEFDFDGGGLETGLEWVFGGDPTDGSDDESLAPTLDNTTDADFFIFTYRRADAAAADANTAIKAEYGTDLTGWTEAVDDSATTNNVIITVTDDGADTGVDLVEVKLRRSALAADGKLFARVNAVVTLPLVVE